MKDWEKTNLGSGALKPSAASVSCFNQSRVNRSVCCFKLLHFCSSHTQTHTQPRLLAPRGHTRCFRGNTHSCNGPKMVTWPYRISTGKPQLLDTTHASGVPGGGVGHGAVGSSSCSGWRNSLGLHISPGSLAERLRVAARQPKSHGVCYAYSFRLVPPRWCLKSKWR